MSNFGPSNVKFWTFWGVQGPPGPLLGCAYVRETWGELGSLGFVHYENREIFRQTHCIRIIDKTKTIFKLSNGDYVDPDRMESVYIQSKYIAQIFVHGSSLKSTTVAVVVPDEPTVKLWAESKSIQSKSLSFLCNNKELKVKTCIR